MNNKAAVSIILFLLFSMHASDESKKSFSTVLKKVMKAVKPYPVIEGIGKCKVKVIRKEPFSWEHDDNLKAGFLPFHLPISIDNDEYNRANAMRRTISRRSDVYGIWRFSNDLRTVIAMSTPNGVFEYNLDAAALIEGSDDIDAAIDQRTHRDAYLEVQIKDLNEPGFINLFKYGYYYGNINHPKVANAIKYALFASVAYWLKNLFY